MDEEEQDIAAEEGNKHTTASKDVKKQQKTKAQRDVVYQRQSNLSEDVKGCFINLEITCRIMFLCDFNLPASRIIKAVWGDSVQRSDWEWDESNDRIGWNAANWKRRAILNMEVRKYNLESLFFC